MGGDLIARLRLLEERVAALELGLVGVVEPFVLLGFTPQEAQLVGLLLKRQIVTRDMAMTVLYGLRPDGDQPSAKVIDVFLVRIRRKLGARGVRLHTVWGQGWMLADKAIVRGWLAQRAAA